MNREFHKHNKGSSDTPLEIEGFVPSISGSISQSGLLCRTSRKLDEMTLLDIKFQLPQIEYKSVEEDGWIKCSGVVVHCEKKDQENVELASELPYEVAIFFDRISDKYRNLLAKYAEGSNREHA